MTATEMVSLIGKTRGYVVNQMEFDVRIEDVKPGGWGRTLVLIHPINGQGSQWVNLDSLTGA